MPIARHFLKQISQEAALADIKIDKNAEEALMHYHWPGNAREISNVLERTLSTIEGDTITQEHLPFYLKRFQLEPIENNQTSLKEVHTSAEKEAIKLALEQTGYNKAQAAKILGINRTLLYKKMAKHQIALHPD
jgi:DNA-binding NtrC family response regulator